MDENHVLPLIRKLGLIISDVVKYYIRISGKIFLDSGAICSPSADVIYGKLQLDTFKHLILHHPVLAKPAFLSMHWWRIIDCQEYFRQVADRFEMKVAKAKKCNSSWDTARVEETMESATNELFGLYERFLRVLSQIPVIESVVLPDLPPPHSYPNGNDVPLAPFEYAALTSPKGTIRLVKMEFGSADLNSEIHLTSRIVYFRDGVQYATLSYTWGNPCCIFLSETDASTEPRTDIPIICDGRVLKVGENLYRFLCRWRLILTKFERATKSMNPAVVEQSRPPDEFWIDAICINQENVEEKSSQVSMMGDIYTHSQKTWIWLGEKDAFSKPAIDLIHTMANKIGNKLDETIEKTEQLDEHEILDDLGLPDLASWRWFALFAFFQRQWFQRSWVIQEMALSSHIEVICGAIQFPWDLFTVTCALLSQSGLANKIDLMGMIEMPVSQVKILKNRFKVGSRQLAKRSDQCLFKQGFYHRLNSAPRSPTLVNKITFLRMLDSFIRSDDTFFNRSMLHRADATAMLVDLWMLSRANLCSDPKDKVFACASLVNKDVYRTSKTVAARRQLLPDYKKSVSEVYQEAAWFTLLTHAGLQILTLVGHTPLDNPHDVPSWVPDFSQVSTWHGFWELQMHLHGIGWLAAGRSSWEIPPKDTLYGRHLMVKVVFVDKISNVQDKQPSGNKLHQYTDMVEFAEQIAPNYSDNKSDGQDLFEVLWRTVVADCVSGKTPASSRHALEFERAYLKEVLKARDDLLVGNIDTGMWMRIIRVMTFMKILGWLRDDWGFIYDAVINEPDMTKDYNTRMADIMGDADDETEEFDARVANIMNDYTKEAKEFEEYKENTMNNRKLFFTESGYLGVGDLNVSIGDLVVLMAGCPVPFALRPGTDGRYRLIGDAYVHGIMFGEKVPANDEWEPIILE